jgi:CDP-diacylglycerol--inositol 3-phosphatidyltransferase
MKWVHTPIGWDKASFVPLILVNLTYAQVIAILSFPVFFAKNVINVVQLWKASKILVGVDLAERAATREKLQRVRE